MQSAGKIALAAALLASTSAFAQDMETDGEQPLATAAREAQQALRQTFTNLQFEDFGPAPVKGPLYQANAGGRMLYFAPESGHLLFAAVYDRNGVNVTALAQDAGARKRLKSIDPASALAIGPVDAPQVIEFTDPECPYCQALDRYWSTKAAEGKHVRRLIFFVSGVHAQAAAKAEHTLGAIIQPEAILFGNPAAGLACMADSAAAAAGKVIDPLFWCMGSWGSTYPIAGDIHFGDSVEAWAGLAARGTFMMGRLGALTISSSDGCSFLPSPIWTKSRYKLQLMEPVKGGKCVNIGRPGALWTSGTHAPGKDNSQFMLFEKVICCAGIPVP